VNRRCTTKRPCSGGGSVGSGGSRSSAIELEASSGSVATQSRQAGRIVGAASPGKNTPPPYRRATVPRITDDAVLAPSGWFAPTA
jgi:hypothetical protein